MLAWVALPTKHNYRIGRSEVVFDLPVAPREQPTVDTRRVGNLTDAAIEPGGRRVQLIGTDIAKDGSLTARLTFDEGALIAAAPTWQARQTGGASCRAALDHGCCCHLRGRTSVAVRALSAIRQPEHSRGQAARPS